MATSSRRPLYERNPLGEIHTPDLTNISMSSSNVNKSLDSPLVELNSSPKKSYYNHTSNPFLRGDRENHVNQSNVQFDYSASFHKEDDRRDFSGTGLRDYTFGRLGEANDAHIFEDATATRSSHASLLGRDTNLNDTMDMNIASPVPSRQSVTSTSKAVSPDTIHINAAKLGYDRATSSNYRLPEKVEPQYRSLDRLDSISRLDSIRRPDSIRRNSLGEERRSFSKLRASVASNSSAVSSGVDRASQYIDVLRRGRSFSNRPVSVPRMGFQSSVSREPVRPSSVTTSRTRLGATAPAPPSFSTRPLSSPEEKKKRQSPERRDKYSIGGLRTLRLHKPPPTSSSTGLGSAYPSLSRVGGTSHTGTATTASDTPVATFGKDSRSGVGGVETRPSYNYERDSDQYSERSAASTHSIPGQLAPPRPP
eukprot:gene518-629_t